MYNDNKSMYFQLICNQRVGTYKTLQGMNPMVLIFPLANSFKIIALYLVKIARGEPNRP